MPRHGPSRRRATGILLQGTAAVLGGIALAFGTLGLTLVEIPDARVEERAFKAATTCTEPLPATVAVAREDCLREQEFTVRSVQMTHGKTSRYTAVLSRDAADGSGRRWRQHVDFGSDEPLLDRLKTGERVTATTWRGMVVEAAAHGTSQLTDDNPDGATGDVTVVAALTALGTVAAFGYGWWALTRYRVLAAGRPARALSTEGWTALGVAALAPGSLVTGAALEWSPWWSAPVWVGAAVGVAHLAARREWRRLWEMAGREAPVTGREAWSERLGSPRARRARRTLDSGGELVVAGRIVEAGSHRTPLPDARLMVRHGYVAALGEAGEVRPVPLPRHAPRLPYRSEDVPPGWRVLEYAYDGGRDGGAGRGGGGRGRGGARVRIAAAPEDLRHITYALAPPTE